MIAMIVTRFYFSGTRLPIERSAYYMLVIFMVLFSCLLYELAPQKLLLTCALIIGGFSIFHFAESANLSYFYEWKSDASTRQMMKDLNNYYVETKYHGPEKANFHPYNYFATTSMFYKYLFGYNWMKPIEYSNRITHAEDFYYMPKDSMPLLNGYSYKVIKEYTLSQTILVANLDKKAPIVYADKTLDMCDTVTRNPGLAKYFHPVLMNDNSCIEMSPGSYSPIIACSATNIAGKKDITIEANTEVYFPSGKSGEFDILVQDKDGKTLKWDALKFEDYILQKDGWMTVPLKINYNKIDPGAYAVKIFTWNTGNRPFYISGIKVKITGF